MMPKRAKRLGNVGRLILAQKINAEYMSDGFFGLVVQGETEDKQEQLHSAVHG